MAFSDRDLPLAARLAGRLGLVERPEAVLTAVRAIERTIADQVVFSPA